MADYYIVDSGNIVLGVSAGDDQNIDPESIIKSDDEHFDWAPEAASEFMDGPDPTTLSQLTRFFGREAEYMAVSDYLRSKRRVTKREPEDLIPVDDVELRADGEIIKADDEQQIVFGWAYVVKDKNGEQVIDKSGDFVDEIEEIEKSAYDYVLKSRASDTHHSNVQSGEMVESIVFTPEKIEKMGLPANSVPLGWWVGYKLGDEAWATYKNGATSFSIHGSGTRTKVAP
jgi:hypothetical protein